MQSRCLFKHFSTHTKLPIYILCLLWICGLLLGIMLASYSDHSLTDTLHNALLTAPQFSSLFLVVAIPVSLTAVAVSTPLFALSYPLIFLIALSHGYSGISIYLIYGSCAWLIRPLILFSASCTSVLIWWLLICGCDSCNHKADVRLTTIIFSIIFIINLFVVSPLFDDLTKYF